MSTPDLERKQEEKSPACYRHPMRETHLLCTGCKRYICADCMRHAAVGLQCVECLRQGNRAVQLARTVLGG